MTTDHMELRTAAAQRIAMPGNDGGKVMAHLTMVAVSQIALEELLAAYDALVAAAKPKKGRNAEYPPEFLEAMGAMAAVGLKWRDGTTKPAAFAAWSKALKRGATVQELVEGTKRYAAHCKATDRPIKMAQFFFGPDEMYTAEWAIPRSQLGQAGVWPFPASSQGRVPLAQQQADQKAIASAAAKARLLGHQSPPDDGMTFEMEQP